MIRFNKKKKAADYSGLIDRNNLPKHIGIIMDGNGRWAKKRGLPRSIGHAEGAKAFDKIIDFAGKLGIKVVTCYAFSTENWSRPDDEVAALMSLLLQYLKDGLTKMADKDTKVIIIGDTKGLNEDIKEGIRKIEDSTKDGKSMVLQIALNYGGRQEIISAAQKAAKMAVSGEIKPEDIDDKLLSSLMYNPDVPEPDLIIRPSGEFRLSNFLLWGSAYSELWFSDILWPDFTADDLLKSIYDYQQRSRRFGGI
ncbi:MAG: isoprenyl transferase [Bacillota bacterium]|nr:isoprenyl transferase [Bacillota bacterium]